MKHATNPKKVNQDKKKSPEKSKRKEDKDLDKALEDTFPASDSPAKY